MCRCCGTEAYDFGSQGCCNDVIYDTATQECRNGDFIIDLPDNPGNVSECIWVNDNPINGAPSRRGTPYDTFTHICCDNNTSSAQVVEKKKDEDMCCNGVPYTSATEFCDTQVQYSTIEQLLNIQVPFSALCPKKAGTKDAERCTGTREKYSWRQSLLQKGSCR